jgi:hypothetical protein
LLIYFIEIKILKLMELIFRIRCIVDKIFFLIILYYYVEIIIKTNITKNVRVTCKVDTSRFFVLLGFPIIKK